MTLTLARSVAWLALVDHGLSAEGAENMLNKADSNGRAISARAYVFSNPNGHYDLNLK